jgi:uncharacterized membrane protein YfhO
VQAEVYTCAEDSYQEVLEKLSANQMTDVQVDGNKVSGSVEADEDGTLLLTIPYDQGWTVLVDGEETDFYCVGGALTGIHLSAGTHTISMKFTSPGFTAGRNLSLICLLLMLLSLFWGRRHPDWFDEETAPQYLEIDTEEKENEIMGFTFSDKAEQIEAGIFAQLNARKK